MSNKKMVDIDIDEVVRTTDMAILVKIDDEEIWLPKSQIKVKETSISSGDASKISVVEWLAMDKGLI